MTEHSSEHKGEERSRREQLREGLSVVVVVVAGVLLSVANRSKHPSLGLRIWSWAFSALVLVAIVVFVAGRVQWANARWRAHKKR
jgi:cation transport ATPase